MSHTTASTDRVIVYGHCSLPFESIQMLVATRRFGPLLRARGDFVIVAHGSSHDFVITSPSGLVDYFYAVEGKSRHRHGRTIDEVSAHVPGGFQWNHEAVADYLTYNHPLGNATVAAGVLRVTPGTVLVIPEHRAATVIQSHDPRTAEPVPVRGRSQPEAALDALVDAVSYAGGAGCWLSMSGGLDSRLLLAALLAQGHRPGLLVSGAPLAFDYEVTAQIAQRFSLPMRAVCVDGQLVADGYRRIVPAVGGLLPITNWAGYQHFHVAAISADQPVLIGYCGEYARSYYAPSQGRAAVLAGWQPTEHAVNLITRALPSQLHERERELVEPELWAAFEAGAMRRRLAEVALRNPGQATSALDVADTFFITHYGHRKVAVNLAALGPTVRWRLPFADPTWTRQISLLPRRWKLGDRWHRWAISRLWPKLLDFPDQGYGTHTSRRPPMRYWWSGPTGRRGPFYLDRRMFSHGPVPDLFTDTGGGLAGLADPWLLDTLIAEQRSGDPRRHHLCYALAALALWRDGRTHR